MGSRYQISTLWNKEFEFLRLQKRLSANAQWYRVKMKPYTWGLLSSECSLLFLSQARKYPMPGERIELILLRRRADWRSEQSYNVF